MSTTTPPQLAPAEQHYVPTDQWPDVTAMLEGFGEPSLPASSSLEGAPLDVRFENGWIIRHTFQDGRVTWTITDGEGAGQTGTHPYRAVEVRPGIFFVDFVKGEGVRSSDLSMVLDTSDGRVTVADSSFIDRDGRVRMSTAILSGRVVGTGEIEPRRRTSELVGKRIYYRYSPTEHYEHIYLNAGTFVWHCVRGAEVGLADADPVQVFELADGIVLLHWSETVMPVESIVTIDLTNQRSIGRMFCWDGPTLDTVHIPFDSRFTILDDTPYPAE
ncbi:MoaF C-terminal domain-containing protein [Microbacterium sp. B2969]|uniref:MoaF C-terminal domain-containing protein n=1 Tax=Microbacterium alkaliflavum TaxID=3248839 RepID=A0ABW7QCF0_9MICO